MKKTSSDSINSRRLAITHRLNPFLRNARSSLSNVGTITFVQNVHKFLRRSSASGFLLDTTIRGTQELVTPKYRATLAPEYPSSFTAIQDVEQRASTTSRLRLPERSSFKEIAH
jgi:hypothetical protein